MRYLVTGGAGFIGSHLCELLLGEGHEVCAYDDLSTGAADNVAALKANPHFTLVVDNLFSAPHVAELIDQADVVFHLAASVGVFQIVERRDFMPLGEQGLAEVGADEAGAPRDQVAHRG